MEAKRPERSFARIFVSLHIFHVCLSFGLIIAIVLIQHNNDARFKSLVVKCDCKTNHDGVNAQAVGQSRAPSSFTPQVNVRRSTALEEERHLYSNSSKLFGKVVSSKSEETLTGSNSASSDSLKSNSSETNEYSKTKSSFQNITENATRQRTENTSVSSDAVKIKVTSGSQGINANITLTELSEFHKNTTPDTIERGGSSSSGLGKENKTVDATVNSERMPKKINRTNNSWEKNFEKKLKSLEGKLDLLWCLDELKAILDDYLVSGRPLKNGCKLLKGDRGEKGCAGTSFAAPSFQPMPQSVIFDERNTAALSCNAVANPHVEITWYRNNVQITSDQENVLYRYRIENRDVTPKAPIRARYCPSEIPHPVTQSTLMIKNSNGSDTGTYICKARNILGTSSFTIHVLIQVYVEFITIPSNTTVVQGKNVTLSCQASGVPQPAITWYRKDDGPMPSQHTVVLGDLYIINIKKEEEGTFVCRATNVLGSKTSEATVTVNVFPKITSFINYPITVNESTSLVLPCNATGYPIPEIRWTKTGGSLPNDRHAYDSQLLNITNVIYNDRGEYVCSANNTVGVVNKSIKVFVQVGPKIIQRPSQKEIGYLAKKKRIEFKLFSSPEAVVLWKKPYWIQNASRFTVEDGSLVIDNVKYTDAGLYHAVARNLLGEVRISTFLDVEEPVAPWISLSPSEVKVLVVTGRSLVKNCAAFGKPKPTIVWKYNGSVVMSTTRASLTLSISSAKEDQSGRYTCEASNRFGTASQDVDIRIEQLAVHVETNCGHTRTDRKTGYVKTPGYPSNYGDNLKCTWRFTSNSRIRLSFERFDTEQCCDKVKIYDGGSSSSTLLAEYSGTILSIKSMTSSSSMLYITFDSDRSTTKRGFSAKYQGI